jgi:hypothetical protein
MTTLRYIADTLDECAEAQHELERRLETLSYAWQEYQRDRTANVDALESAIKSVLGMGGN